jgi:putative DNA primase/helicase
MSAALAEAVTKAPLALVDDERWPVPDDLKSERPPVAAFDHAQLPACMRQMVADASERMQCPPEFLAVGALVVAATVVGRGCGIMPKVEDDDFFVVGNLWGAIVGPPSVTKSPALKLALAPLDELVREERERTKQREADFKFDQQVAKAREKKLNEEIDKAVRKGGTDINALRAQFVEQPEAPAERRYMTNDATVEKLGELLRHSQRGLLMFRDELTGFLAGLEKQGHEQDRAFYLEAWNGTSHGFSYDRIQRGQVYIESPCISLLGGIQPGPLIRYVSDAIRGGAGNDGLMQRFQLLVFPDVAKDWRLVDKKPSEAARSMFVKAMRELNLRDFGELGATVREKGPPFFHFAPDAQERFYAWWTAHERRLRTSGEHESVIAHLAKFRSLVPKLALLIHLAEVASLHVNAGPVSDAATERAVWWASFLESHARRVYGLSIQRENDAVVLLGARIQRGDVPAPFTSRDVYRRGWSGLSDREDVEKALSMLEDAGWVRARRVETGGKAKTVYDLNPRIEHAATEADDDEA